MTPSLLMTNAYIHSVAEPYANSLHADNGVIAWLGSDEAGQQMVAATTTGPVDTRDQHGGLLTSAFVDGFSVTPLSDRDTRVAISATSPSDHGVYYAPFQTATIDADGLYIGHDQLGELTDIVASIKPPLQLLVESADEQELDHILSALEQQPAAALMRSRHRILANHPITQQQISRLVATHASITVVPEIVQEIPKIHAPVASLVSQGVHVATGTGEWTGSLWQILTALVEHDDPDQRVSTRAAFNTVSRDGVRVWPSRVAQAHMAAGQIAVGSPADFNVWRAEQLGLQAPDEKAAHWSTDKRARTALLPILSSDEQAPKLELLIRHGQVV